MTSRMPSKRVTSPCFLFRTPFAFVMLGVILCLPSGGPRAQQLNTTSETGTSITASDGATLAVDARTGQITVTQPKTGTTTTIETKSRTVSVANSNGVGRSWHVPYNPAPTTPNNGGAAGDTKFTVGADESGSFTVTITNEKGTDTFTFKPQTNSQTGETTTTVTNPADPKSSVSVTVDRNDKVTNTGASTPAPGGQTFEVTTGPEGLTHIYSKNQNGQVVSDRTLRPNNGVVIGEDKIPHVVNPSRATMPGAKQEKRTSSSEAERQISAPAPTETSAHVARPTNRLERQQNSRALWAGTSVRQAAPRFRPHSR